MIFFSDNTFQSGYGAAFSRCLVLRQYSYVWQMFFFLMILNHKKQM